MFSRDRMIINCDTTLFEVGNYWEDVKGDYWKVKYKNPWNSTVTLEKTGFFENIAIRLGVI